MIYQVDLDREIRRLISHFSPERKKKIKESLKTIAENPHCGKPLQEELLGYYSYRVGALRIVYSINKPEKTVHLVAIGPRRTIYEELEKDAKKLC